ncbi:MAG TPA: hypothetical protein VFK68_07070 [Propionibacteriaceae bacterium]|nr:hypothetical protein [Propionibacteriaceae bacterium]
MSWLDLPPLDLIGAAGEPVAAPDADGRTTGTLGLVAGGLVGVWGTHSVEVWRPDNPAALAAILGVGEVERVDVGRGFAECGRLDRDKATLQVRNRNPRSGSPRTFPGRPVGLSDPSLDPHAAWQLRHMLDVALRRDERWALAPGGLGDGDVFLGVETAQWQGQRRLVVTAQPAVLARRWPSGRLGVARNGVTPSRSAGVPLTPQGVGEAVTMLVAAMSESGLSPWEFMPVFPMV